MNKLKIGDTVLVKSKEEIERIFQGSMVESMKENNVDFVSDFCGLTCEVVDIEQQNIDDTIYYSYLLSNNGEKWWYVDSWIRPNLKEKLDRLLNE